MPVTRAAIGAPSSEFVTCFGDAPFNKCIVVVSYPRVVNTIRHLIISQSYVRFALRLSNHLCSHHLIHTPVRDYLRHLVFPLPPPPHLRLPSPITSTAYRFTKTRKKRGASPVHPARASRFAWVPPAPPTSCGQAPSCRFAPPQTPHACRPSEQQPSAGQR